MNVATIPADAINTVNSKVIGIYAGQLQKGLPPKFTFQSTEFAQVIKPKAIDVPVIP